VAMVLSSSLLMLSVIPTATTCAPVALRVVEAASSSASVSCVCPSVRMTTSTSALGLCPAAPVRSELAT
jgi:hypothetical protein